MFDEYKECPFCLSKCATVAKVKASECSSSGIVYVGCITCGTRGPRIKIENADDNNLIDYYFSQAIKLWNSRR